MENKSYKTAFAILAILTAFGCVNKKTTKDIVCDAAACSGTYSGPEFVNGDDIAHQFSNKMSAAVGDKLKELHSAKQYSKVDFSKIEMSTKGI